MAVSLFNCWCCDKPLHNKEIKTVSAGRGKKKATKIVADDFFYCDAKCRETHEKEQAASTRASQQWSEYMCGEREKPPKAFAHLAEKYGPSKGRKTLLAVTEPEEVEEAATGRKCGKCGKPGHNARTCGRAKSQVAGPKKVTKKRKQKRKASKKAGARKQYQCSVCGGLGHNARTCKENK